MIESLHDASLCPAAAWPPARKLFSCCQAENHIRQIDLGCESIHSVSAAMDGLDSAITFDALLRKLQEQHEREADLASLVNL